MTTTDGSPSLPQRDELREDEREALEEAARVFGWQHLVRYSGMAPEWLDCTLLAVVRAALAARTDILAERVADAAQTIALMPPEHGPRTVVAANLTGHSLGCTCTVCEFVRADELAERVARVEALADEWEAEAARYARYGDGDSPSHAQCRQIAHTLEKCAAALTSDRAATEGGGDRG